MRIKNSSPFYKNQQAKRFGIEGASRNTNTKERLAERRAQEQQRSTSGILQDNFKRQRDENELQTGHLSASFKASRIQEEAQTARLLGDQEAAGTEVEPSRLNKHKAYLRSLQFAGVRDKFLTIKGSGSAHKKVRLAYYLVPAFVFTGAAFSNFISVTFGIYLKH